MTNQDNHQDSASNLDFVTRRIVERYGHPARTAYLYMFRIDPGSDAQELIPQADHILAAWIDEGGGLVALPAELALERCLDAYQAKPDLRQQRQQTPHQRRQMMARVISFSVRQESAAEIKVHLSSRALCFTPKGDRFAEELWKPTEGGWYSSHRPDEE